MVDTVVLETNDDENIKVEILFDNEQIEFNLADTEEHAVVFVSFLEARTQKQELINLYISTSYRCIHSGDFDRLKIKFKKNVLKSSNVTSQYKIFFKEMNPEFSEIQIRGFTEDKVSFLRNNYAKIKHYIICHSNIKHNFIDNKNSNISFNQNTSYSALSERGFILSNISSLKINSNHENNLMEAFTTTELANNLFDKGTMLLTWGMTSYQYFIGFKNDFPSFVSSKKFTRQFHGQYKISGDFNQLTLIKGEYLDDLSSMPTKIVTKFNLDDEKTINGFYYIDLNLFIIEEDFKGEKISPVCFLILDYLDYEIHETIPALNYNIFM